MDLSLLFFYFLSHLLFLTPSVHGWDSDDHEIFDLVSALTASEGKGTTFYTFLNITKSATLAEINKASRKRSLELHPDKNPNVKDIEARFARLGVITSILRDQEKRERYNFFHDNGVPKWKGTGYMYSRWQPGLGFVIIFLFGVSTLTHYGVQHVNYRSELSRIKRFQIAAKQAAYGPRGLQPNPSTSHSDDSSTRQVPRKKVKISIGKSLATSDRVKGTEESEIPAPKSRQERRRALQSGSKLAPAGQGQAGWIEMVVEGDRVWIVAEDGSELPLDESAATKPSFKNTFVPALAQRLLNAYLPNSAPPPSTEGVTEAAVKSNEDSESDDAAKLNATTSDSATKSGAVRKRRTGKAKK